MKMEQTKCSETPAYKIKTPRNHPKERIQHCCCWCCCCCYCFGFCCGSSQWSGSVLC